MGRDLSSVADLAGDRKMHGMSGGGDDSLSNMLQQVIDNSGLTALFQPIVNLQDGGVLGHEGLIRGPEDGPLHSPLALFRAAEEHGKFLEIEKLCRKVILESFASKTLPGKLFLNVSPESLIDPSFKKGETLELINRLGIDPKRIIIEVTEHHPLADYSVLQDAVRHYREMGFGISIDDLGDQLTLWAELGPEYVKVDRNYIRDIDSDATKQEYVGVIQRIADLSGTKVVVEGIETPEEHAYVRELGIAYGQGYLFGRPVTNPGI